MERKFFATTVLCLITLFVITPGANAEKWEKIKGPWLWMIAPTEPGKGGKESIHIDSLAVASGGTVTEHIIAHNGANEGDQVGDYKWTSADIDVDVPGFAWLWDLGDGNINKTIGDHIKKETFDDHSSYALIGVKSVIEQTATINVSSDDAIKIWLNGIVVGYSAMNRGADAKNPQNKFLVNLRQGFNLCMVKVSDRDGQWAMYVGLSPKRQSVTYSKLTAAELENAGLNKIPRPIVRLIHFIPEDRKANLNNEKDIERNIVDQAKKVQKFYADAMAQRGYGRKTFKLEWDEESDAPVVHKVRGIHNEAYYMEDIQRVRNEVRENEPGSLAKWYKKLPLIFIKTNLPDLDPSDDGVLCGRGDRSRYRVIDPLGVSSEPTSSEPIGMSDVGGWAMKPSLPAEVWDVGGWAIVPASGHCVSGGYGTWNIAHELGHAFGLFHDFRDTTYVMSYGDKDNNIIPDQLSECAAHWLDVHPAFNDNKLPSHWETKLHKITGPLAPELIGNTQKPTFTFPPGKNKIEVEVDDRDGIHQVQLVYVHKVSRGAEVLVDELLGDCSNLNGVTNITITLSISKVREYALNHLDWNETQILLRVVDRKGSATDWRSYILRVQPPDNGNSDVPVKADVNDDGIVDVDDLIEVFLQQDKKGENLPADVNNDKVVNVQDICLVAGVVYDREFDCSPAAPALRPLMFEGLTAAEVQRLLTQARQMEFTDPTYLRGIAVLEQLLALLLPKETTLLANYPNPFNPETWLPYQLSESADVTLTIYDIQGRVVRALDLGHQGAGMYHSRSRAAHWNGRNAQGESVASGIYFYTLTAGDFAATRKMLIRK